MYINLLIKGKFYYFIDCSVENIVLFLLILFILVFGKCFLNKKKYLLLDKNRVVLLFGVKDVMFIKGSLI